jgi:hypothetical protein
MQLQIFFEKTSTISQEHDLLFTTFEEDKVAEKNVKQNFINKCNEKRSPI